MDPDGLPGGPSEPHPQAVDNLWTPVDSPGAGLWSPASRQVDNIGTTAVDDRPSVHGPSPDAPSPSTVLDRPRTS